jgi:AraC family transcriptional regulator, positive regulator of tynA and feaB
MRAWKTSEFKGPDQFSYWREVICEAFAALDPRARTAGHNFPSAVVSSRIGEISCSTVDSQAQLVRRGRSEIHRDPNNSVFINLQISGICAVTQDGRESVVEPGQFTIVDTARPYQLGFDKQFLLLCTAVPRDLLLSHVSAPRLLCARSYDTRSGAGHIAASAMRGLWQAGEAIERTAADRVIMGMCELIAAAAQSSELPQLCQSDMTRVNVLAAAKENVLRCLDDPLLSAKMIAHRLHVSTRTLHRAFEDADATIQGFARKERLARCAADLRNKADHRTISEIALRWGFNDIPHFSRTFRAHFGMSAIEFRRQAAMSTSLGDREIRPRVGSRSTVA